MPTPPTASAAPEDSVGTAAIKPRQAVIIRRLGTEDAGSYRAFRLRALKEHPDAFTSGFDEENEKPLPHSEARLSASGNERIWGAFAGQELIGMVGLACETRVKNRHKATLFGMFVAPEHAGRGIGRQLIDALMADAKKRALALIVLTVTEGNQAAIALYDRAGFKAFGTEPDAIRVDGKSFGKTHMYLRLGDETGAP